jgi:hypothetical protein
MLKDSEVIATVLRSYSCVASEKFAYWLQERLATSRYGRIRIDPNEGLTNDPGAWYDKFRRLVAQDRYMIALLSPGLNIVDDSDHYPGISLASEILYFWDKQQNDPAVSDLLIPICIDCRLEEFSRPRGEYEQLQDIVVPYISSLNPLQVTTDSFYGNARETFELSDAVARRMGIRPLIQTAEQVGSR